MVSGKTWPGGDPNLQRQNEPSIAVSTRNPMHLLAGANDYRTVDLAGLLMQDDDSVTPDAWLGVFKSFDGGMTWKSTLLPGCPYTPTSGENPCLGSPPSPLRGRGYLAGADPTVRAGAHGLFYYSFIAFDRNNTKNGALAVASFIDNNNKEAGDTIRYLGTSIIDSNTGGQFADKPYMAVDRPRTGGGTCTIGGPGASTQNLKAGNIYVAYTVFLGSGQNPRSKLMLAVSSDCAKSWQQQKISEGDLVNQGATIAIDPDSGALYVAWRRFKTPSATDTMVLVKSTDAGKTFSKSVEIVPAIFPFDQKTSKDAVAFRTNSYPTMAVLNGRVYIAWADRLTSATADARIVLRSSADGLVWSNHGAVDLPQTNPPLPYNTDGRGHQIMPALTAAGGKLMLVYYDFREDHTAATYTSENQHLYTEHRAWAGNDLRANVFKSGAADAGLSRRHTIDVRLVQITPTNTGVAAVPARLSQYAFGTLHGAAPSPLNPIKQLGFNPPNLPIFRQGTVPFFGDYIDVAALQYVPNGAGWIANTADSNSTVFHAAWTDNRNVFPGDVSKYAPPGSTGGTSLFDPAQSRPACGVNSKPGVLNQDVYTARITQGLVVGSYGNAKTLSPTLQRAFSVFVQNTRSECKSYRLTIDAPGVTASFKPLNQAIVDKLEVTIGRKSGVARTVFVRSSTPKASVKVKVEELDVSGGCTPNGLPTADPLTGGLKGTVILNPEIENPEIENPEIENPVPIAVAEVYNPEIENPEIENPEIENPEIENPEIENPEIENVEVANPEIENPEIENPEIENPEIENPEIENIPLSGKITDVSWKVTNKGNTSASFSAKMLANRNLPTGIKLQLLVHKLYRSPVANPDPAANCELKVQTQNVVLVNIPNPVIPTSTQDIENPEIENPAVTNGTFALAPGETAKITLRFLDPDWTQSPNLCGPAPLPACSPNNPSDYNPVSEIVPAPVSQSDSTPYAATLQITTATLPDGLRNQAYPSTQLQFTGGTGTCTKTWSAPAGSLPPGLSLSAAGAISGTPSAAGTFSFLAKVAESGCSQRQSDSQLLTIRVANPLTVTTSALLPPGFVGSALNVTLASSGGIAPVQWSLTSGSLPAGVNLSSAGVLSGAPTGTGTFLFRLTAQDSSSPAPQTVYRDFDLRVYPAISSNITFSSAPSTTLVDHAICLWVKVKIAGAGGGVPVSVSMPPNPGGGVLSGTLTQFTDSTGEATFNDLRINQAGNGYTLIAWHAFTGSVVSSPFNVVPFVPGALQRAQHTATLLPGGDVLVAGGMGPNFCATHTTEIHRIGSGTVVAGPPMSLPREWHTATWLPVQGRVLMAAGTISSFGAFAYTLKTAELYAPVASPGLGSFAPTGNLTTEHRFHTATLLNDGKVLIAEGMNGGTTIAELYDPATGLFSSAGTSAWRTFPVSSLLQDGRVLFTSGSVTPELYTPGGGFSATGSLVTSRTYHTSTLLPTGKVLIAGGNSNNVQGADPSALQTVELYDPATGTFSLAGNSMTTKRQGHTATLLSDGKVLLLGGHNGTATLTSAEIYDPSTGSFIPLATSLGLPRIAHRATLLPDGRVFVSGGGPSGPQFGEIYTVPLTIVTTSLPDGVQAVSYTATVAAVGGSAPRSWSFSGGAPSGLLINPATGQLNWLSPTAGTHNFTVQVTDAASQVRTQNLTLRIAVPLSITTASLPAGALSTPYSATLTTTGGTAPMSWSLASGSLPTGLSLSGAGVISGTPGATGTFNFTVRATDSAVPQQVATRALALTVSVPPAVALVYSQGPKNVPANQSIAPAVEVYAMLGFHAVPGVTVTISIEANPSAGILSGTLSAVTNGAGIATFSDLSIDQPGVGYTLRASASPTQYNTSLPFTVSGPSQLGASLMPGRYGHTATLLPTGKIVVFGGRHANTNNVIHGEAAFDPVTKSFSAFGDGTGTPTVYHTALALPQGVILLSGGIDPFGVVQSIQQYMSMGNGGIWAAPAMLTARNKHTATVLPDGRVLLAGGYGAGGAPLAQAEVFTPPLGVPNLAVNMPAARAEHTATLLPNGLVLLAGGNGGVAGVLNTALLFDPVSNSYTATSNTMATARYRHTATLLPTGEVLIAGGQNVGGDLSSAEIYDPATNLFTPTGGMSNRHAEGTATLLPNGKVLIAGGSSSAPFSMDIYDRATGTFTPTSIPMVIPRSLHTATLMADGSVLLAGSMLAGNSSSITELYYTYDPPFSPPGFTSAGSLTTPRGSPTQTVMGDGRVLIVYGGTAEIYNPRTGIYTSIGPLNTSRVGHTATLLPNGKVLVAGGNPIPADMTAEVFDPASNSFTYTAGPMSSQRIGHTATLLVSGKVLLAGGYISSITRPSVGTADLYDPQTNSFSATGSMAFGRDSHTATRLPDGKVLVAGGYSGSQLSGYTVRSDIEVYDPVAGTFSLLAASMGTPRYGHTATVLVLGGARILFAGGHTSTGSNAATSGAEVYDMAAPLPTILPTASMASARADHTATMLPNGKVLFAGGHDGATVLSSAEIYDPVTNVFTSAGSLSAGRYGQGAALLGYGSVLLSGGTLQSGSATASAELYRPGQ